MVAAVATVRKGEDLFQGVRVLTSREVGLHSLLDQVGLKARAVWGGVERLTKRLELDEAETLAAHYEPRFTLRPIQRPPADSSDWWLWLFLGGRGTGKTYAGAAAVVDEARKDPKARILIVGPTDSDIRKNQIDGPSGILAVAPPWFRPVHKRSRRELRFPNGAVAFYVTAAAGPGKFRGNNATFAWLDEIVAWTNDPQGVYQECRTVTRLTTPRMDALGLPARTVITTTPNGSQLFRDILEEKQGLIVARSTTFENAANLDAVSLRRARALLGTQVGAQEFLGQLFFGLDSALYQAVDWNRSRVRSLADIPAREGKPLFDKLIIGADPATGEKVGADLHGLVVEGFREEADGLLHVYVLEDLSLQDPDPGGWATAAVQAFHRYKHLAPPRRAFIFAETNTGGNLVKDAVRLRDKRVRVKGIRAYGCSKAQRHTPVAALAEAGLVHMVGHHPRLEKQLAKFTGQEGGHGRDDRADAFAWPIYKFAAVKVQNAGAAGRTRGAAEEEDNGEE